MRLDIAALNADLGIESRTAAKELVLGGKIAVNGKIVTKPSAEVSGEDTVSLADGSPSYKPKYVGRGGYKLEGALDDFGISLSGAVCFDIGASTGGFTDCMLQRGALKVYAVDVGTSQLHEKLRKNPAVVVAEALDIRSAEVSDLPEKADFIAVDVSFISLKLVLPEIKRFLKDGGIVAALIKPQFEAGKIRMKNGILKDEKLRSKIIQDIENFAKSLNFNVKGVSRSKIDGGGGNAEYFILLAQTE